MKRLTIAAAAIAAGLTSFAAHASDRDTTAQPGDQNAANGMKCYLTGCYDAEGNKVDKTATASVGAAARDAIGEAKGGKGAKAGLYADLIATHAKANGVPLGLAWAVVRVESNFRVNARGSAGEVGLMQIKPSTARGLGYSGSIKALYNPENNIKFGMKYLGMAHKLGGGTTCGTILKYNAGHGAKRMNKISAAYCSKVKRHLGA